MSVRMLAGGFLCILLFGGCSEENSSPTLLRSGIVILVDNSHANAVSAPCGTENAVCRTITDGLLSAAMYPNEIPTILVKSGPYEFSSPEPTGRYWEPFPIEVGLPVIIKAEHTYKTIIGDTNASPAFIITAPDVKIEGFTVNSNAYTFVLIKGGQATLHNIRVKEESENLVEVLDGGSVVLQESTLRNSFGTSMIIGKGSSARIEHSKIYGMVESQGTHFTMKDSIIFCKDCWTGSLWIESGQNILQNNTLYGYVEQEWEEEFGAELTETAFKGNTIYGRVRIFEGNATFDDNTIIGDAADDGSYRGAMSSAATLALTNNTIIGNPQALLLWDMSTTFLSHNRFNSEVDNAAIIECEKMAIIETDGTNTLLNSSGRIICDRLPQTPGSDPF